MKGRTEASSEARTKRLGVATRVRITKLKLTVTAGPDRGLVRELGLGPLVIGTGAEVDLQLSDETISQRHCELVVLPDSVVVRDLGSTNGVLIERVRVREAHLALGAKLCLGDTRLLLKETGAEEVLRSPRDGFGRLRGESAPMQALYAKLEAIAQSGAPLLIQGETGTGKDLAAEAVHTQSPRADQPLVIFDCGAAAPSLLEAELFGYARGAFTGAEQAREGLVEAAAGGTLVLDEIGELPLELQPKLLRLIERREVRRLGSNQPKLVDVRIVACTLRSLAKEVEHKRFREDLYFRLSTLNVRLPALRERIEDIPLLVDSLFATLGAGLTFADLPAGEQEMLLAHRWPGNVRELRNVVERFLTFPKDGITNLLEAEQPSAGVDGFLPLPAAREKAQEQFEVGYLRLLMARAEGSVSEAARLAEVSRQFIQRLLRKHGLR